MREVVEKWRIEFLLDYLSFVFRLESSQNFPWIPVCNKKTKEPNPVNREAPMSIHFQYRIINHHHASCLLISFHHSLFFLFIFSQHARDSFGIKTHSFMPQTVGPITDVHLLSLKFG